jgi:hypothetical protein
MTTIMIYWALVVANEPGFVGSVHRTYEPCYRQVVDLRKAGIESACYPTTHPDVLMATDQLRSLAILFYDNTDRNSR